MKKIVYLTITLCLTIIYLQAQTTLYDTNVVQDIHINFSVNDWDYRMDTAKYGSEGYLMASVTINGLTLDSVGVKYKGNSSYDSSDIKNPLNISFDEFKNQNYQGYGNVKLSNAYSDPSLIREVLAYSILGNYMHCPKSNFANVYINGVYIGLYSNSENIDKKFCADHFYSSTGTFVKCNPLNSPGPSSKSNYKYIGSDSLLYENLYELKSKNGWNDFISMCNSVTNSSATIENEIDMDRAIWMLAFNNLFVNLDSYNGVFSQNHYTYKDKTNHFNPIIWDLNMCFGAFPYAGNGATSYGTLTNIGLQQYSPFNHAIDTSWPLINIVLNNATYKRKYIAHIKTMLEEMIVSNEYINQSLQFQNTIQAAVNADTNLHFGINAFMNGLDSAYTFGSYTVPGIRTLMQARNTFLQTLPEFSAIAPTISTPTWTTNFPIYNSQNTIQTTITNATNNSVFMGYRFDETLKFSQLQLFDDGLHNDGAANDNVFGNTIIMNGGNLQYYIYAENNDAGIFLPQRAEHEFLTLKVTSYNPTLNDVVINEIVANNENGEKDEYNDREDWIELYNNSTNLIDLSNLYLSNNFTQLLKWKFPNGTTINPKSYFIIWADDDSLEMRYHTNFNLSKDTGALFLSNANGTILDSVTFTNQQSDKSFGRFINGTGNFTVLNPTFGFENNNWAVPVSETIKNDALEIYPNPASNELLVEFEGTKNIVILTIYGQKLFSIKATDATKINVSNYVNGVYILKCGSITKKFIVSK